MKNYLIIFSVLALVACNDSKQADEIAREKLERENEVRQHTIDSLEIIRLKESNAAIQSTTVHHNSTSAASATEEPEAKKGMSNKTKGALIGTGAGIVGGAATGAAVSKDKGKGAVVGGIIGGAVGSGIGYGAGAKKDQKEKDAEE